MSTTFVDRSEENKLSFYRSTSARILWNLSPYLDLSCLTITAVCFESHRSLTLSAVALIFPSKTSRINVSTTTLIPIQQSRSPICFKPDTLMPVCYFRIMCMLWGEGILGKIKLPFWGTVRSIRLKCKSGNNFQSCRPQTKTEKPG